MSTLLHRRTLFVFAVAALALAALPLQAAPAGPVADVLLGTTQVQWSPVAEFAGFRLTVAGPNGTEQLEFGPGESPLFDLASLAADIDGHYSWELRAIPQVDAQAINAAARTPGFAAGERQRPEGLPPEENLVQSGSFMVAGGAIVQPTEELGPDLRVDGAGGNKVTGELGYITGELVHASDVEIQGSLCVGFDCTSSESFGADTIRLKENNLRIHFNDTSNSASFPTNDWRIEVNSSSNGGASYFSLIDVDAGRTPFRVDAGAPTDALRVESTGDIGLGTSNPVVELHIADGDTPTLRLEQNNSSGFTAQTWDVAGNEANFFVRDVTNGSRLSFRIKPGAPESSLFIAADGDVGLGTDNPGVTLDVTDSEGHARVTRTNSGNAEILTLVNDGPIDFAMERTDIADRDWRFEAENAGFFISRIGSGATEFELTNDGDLTVAGDVFSSTCTTGNPCAPDYVFQPDYELLPLDEVASFIEREGHLPNVPSAEELTGPISLGQLQMKLLEKVEELTLYTLDQHRTISELRQQIEELKAAQAEE